MTPPSRSAMQSMKPDNEQGETELPEVLQAVEAAASRQLFEDTLNTYYIPLEIWYTRTIIDKVRHPAFLRSDAF